MSLIIKSGNSVYLASVDSLGNLQVLATPAAIANTAAAWTSGTVINTTQLLLATGGYGATLLQLNQGSTITAGAVTFEGTYDGINWITFPAVQVVDPATFLETANPYTFTPSTNYPVLLITGGFQQVRVRLSTAILGSGTVTPYWTLLSNNPQAAADVVTVLNAPIQPNIFKTVQVTAAGNTAAWTPTSGKMFRLLKYMVEATSNVSQVSGGVLTISFQDGTTPIPFAHDLYVPSPSLKLFAPYNSGWIELGGNGYLSVLANNVLNANLSAALASGNVRVTVCGTEM